LTEHIFSDILKALTIWFLIFILSCKPLSKTQQDCYTKLKSELSKDWKLIADSGYYESKIIYEINSIKSNRECIQQMDSTKIVQLLGLPNEFRQSENLDRPGSVLKYNLTPPSTFSYPYNSWGSFWISLDTLKNVQFTWLFYNGIPFNYK
jgi:hypothetical protein